jgi:hypothetical protein
MQRPIATSTDCGKTAGLSRLDDIGSVENQPEDECKEKEHKGEKGKTNENGFLFAGFR